MWDRGAGTHPLGQRTPAGRSPHRASACFHGRSGRFADRRFLVSRGAVYTRGAVQGAREGLQIGSGPEGSSPSGSPSALRAWPRFFSGVEPGGARIRQPGSFRELDLAAPRFDFRESNLAGPRFDNPGGFGSRTWLRQDSTTLGASGAEPGGGPDSTTPGGLGARLGFAKA